MSLIHLTAQHEKYGPIPLCGQAMWEGLTQIPSRNECWECASIAGVPQPIRCIARERQPQGGLWDCACRECTHLQWDAREDESVTLADYRRTHWPEFYKEVTNGN